MRAFNEFGAVWRAPLFSKALYQDVGTRWQGIGFRYLALVLAISWLVIYMKYTVAISGFITNDLPVLLKDFPVITIKDGEASSAATQPYVMRSEKGTPLFVFDARDAATQPATQAGTTQSATRAATEQALTEAPMMMTETTFVFRMQGAPVEFPLVSLGNTTLDRASVVKGLTNMRNALLPEAFPLSWAGSMAYRLMGAVILSVLGLGIASMMRVRMPFAALMRLAAVSMTTGIWIGTLLWLVPMTLGCFGWLFGVVLGVGYFVYGVRVNAELAAPVVAEGAPIDWEKGRGEEESMFP